MIIAFEPLFKDKIWGGHKLRTLFHYDQAGNKTGECWGISAHHEGQTKVKEGPFKGVTLKTLWQSHPELFGHHPSDTFPILVKLIDANDDLSIQVHPDDAYAKQFNSFGKSECWYILDAEEEASIIIGHKAKTKAAFMQYVKEKRFMELVNEIPIKKGDYFYIPAGTIHAIKRGTLLLEVQQSSDITYRFYDYDRLDNNALRPLHLKEACEVVSIPDNTVKTTHDETYFTFTIQAKTGDFKADRFGDFFVIIEGEGIIKDKPVKKGDFLCVTADDPYTIKGPLTYARITLSDASLTP